MQKTIYVIIINLLFLSLLNAQNTGLNKVTSDEVDFLFATPDVVLKRNFQAAIF